MPWALCLMPDIDYLIHPHNNQERSSWWEIGCPEWLNHLPMVSTWWSQEFKSKFYSSIYRGFYFCDFVFMEHLACGKPCDGPGEFPSVNTEGLWVGLAAITTCCRLGDFSIRHVSSQVLEAASPSSACWQGQLLVRALLLAWTQPSHCILTWPFLWVWGERERALVSSLIRTPVLLD